MDIGLVQAAVGQVAGDVRRWSDDDGLSSELHVATNLAVDIDVPPGRLQRTGEGSVDVDRLPCQPSAAADRGFTGHAYVTPRCHDVAADGGAHLHDHGRDPHVTQHGPPHGHFLTHRQHIPLDGILDRDLAAGGNHVACDNGIDIDDLATHDDVALELAGLKDAIVKILGMQLGAAKHGGRQHGAASATPSRRTRSTIVVSALSACLRHAGSVGLVARR